LDVCRAPEKKKEEWRDTSWMKKDWGHVFGAGVKGRKRVAGPLIRPQPGKGGLCVAGREGVQRAEFSDLSKGERNAERTGWPPVETSKSSRRRGTQVRALVQ